MKKDNIKQKTIGNPTEAIADIIVPNSIFVPPIPKGLIKTNPNYYNFSAI